MVGQRDTREDNRFPIEILHVVDGDGFRAKALDGSNREIDVRLYAIDAPESAQKYGSSATSYLKSLAADGRFFLHSKDVDPNGRTIGIVYKDGLDNEHTLNHIMVRLGWAYWYSHYEGGQNELGLREAEATAYMEGKGVWQEPDLERPWDYKNRVRLEQRIYEESAASEAVELEVQREAVDAGITSWTDLHTFASTGNIQRTEASLSGGFNPNVADSEGRTPLHVSISAGVAEALLSKGADVDARTNDGWTPLTVAVSNGSKEVVRALLSGGADPNLPGGPSNWAPLHLAATGNANNPVVDEGRVLHGDVEIILDLLSAGADVGLKTTEGWTPLHVAASNDFCLAADTLVKAGANIFVRDKKGLNPGKLAAQFGHKDYEETLSRMKTAAFPGSSDIDWMGVIDPHPENRPIFFAFVKAVTRLFIAPYLLLNKMKWCPRPVAVVANVLVIMAVVNFCTYYWGGYFLFHRVAEWLGGLL